MDIYINKIKYILVYFIVSIYVFFFYCILTNT